MGAVFSRSSSRMLCKVIVALALLSVASAQIVYSASNLCSQYGWPLGNYPHPTDCRKYLACNGGLTYEQSCPAGLAFNPALLVCDDNRNVNCVGPYAPGVGKK